MQNVFIEVEKYVSKLLSDDLPQTFFYHNFSHTQRVVRSAQKICEGENIVFETSPADLTGYEFYKNGILKSTGSSITEGIGQGRETNNLKNAPIDGAYQITDKEALPIIFDILKYEGLCLGSSSGINIAGAIRMAKEMGPGHTIVTILCDYGTRYQSKLFNPSFLKEKGLPYPDWLE